MQNTTNPARRALVLATLAAMTVGLNAYADDTVVKIGFAGPLTGPSAHQGADLEHAVTIALDEANAKKLKIGSNVVKFQLVSEDDQADPKVGTSVAQRLVDAKVAAVIGHFNSGTSLPASRIYGEAGIPQISPTASNPALTAQGIKSVFRIINSDAQMGAYAGNYIVKDLKAKRVAIIDDRTAYGQGAADEVAKAIKAAGGNIVSREFTNDKTVDFSSILTAAKAANVDLVFFAGQDVQAAPMVKQMRNLGMKAGFMNIGGITNDNFLGMAGNAAEGALAWEYGLPIERMPRGKDLEKKMKAKFGVGIISFAPFAYDATWAAVNAMVKANSTDPKQYLAALKGISFEGISGPISFTDGGDLKQAAATVFTVRGGKWVPLDVKRGQ